MSENTVKTASKLTEATFKTLSNLYGDLYEAVHKYTDQEGDARPEAADDINDRLNRLGQGIKALAPPRKKAAPRKGKLVGSGTLPAPSALVVPPVEVAHAENVTVSGEPGTLTQVELTFNPAPAEGEPHFAEVAAES